VVTLLLPDKYITVKIEGDEEEVQRMKQTLSETVTPDDSDSDGQEVSDARCILNTIVETGGL
jgi:acylphosphatase